MNETPRRQWLGFGILLVGVAVALSVATAVWIDAMSTSCGSPTCGAVSSPPDGGAGAPLTGPLALHRTNGFMEARNQGTLVIDDTCVFLQRGGERVLLIWPVDRTRWHAPTGTIDFQTMDGVILTLWDGQDIVLGGGSSILDRLDWVVPPAPECLGGDAFEVGEVQARTIP